jgi:hypothetical protein
MSNLLELRKPSKVKLFNRGETDDTTQVNLELIVSSPSFTRVVEDIDHISDSNHESNDEPGKPNQFGMESQTARTGFTTADRALDSNDSLNGSGSQGAANATRITHSSQCQNSMQVDPRSYLSAGKAAGIEYKYLKDEMHRIMATIKKHHVQFSKTTLQKREETKRAGTRLRKTVGDGRSTAGYSSVTRSSKNVNYDTEVKSHADLNKSAYNSDGRDKVDLVLLLNQVQTTPNQRDEFKKQCPQREIDISTEVKSIKFNKIHHIQSSGNVKFRRADLPASLV